MALVCFQYCNHCQTNTLHTNARCNNCTDREDRQRIALWNALTQDEKLTDLRKRVEKLEQGPARY